jgi:hypothetical protein
MSLAVLATNAGRPLAATGAFVRDVLAFHPVAAVENDHVVRHAARGWIADERFRELIQIENGDRLFLALQTAVTSAPNDLAIWTANVPTPPDAPSIRTFWPRWI